MFDGRNEQRKEGEGEEMRNIFCHDIWQKRKKSGKKMSNMIELKL